MKLVLALMTQDEEPFLRLHLPAVFLQGNTVFDGAIAVDGGSQDGTVEYLESMGVTVFHRPFDYDWSAQGNFLIKCCEDAGYSHLLRLDPDELMFPKDMSLVRTVLEADTADLLALSRYHFIGDRLHYNAEWGLDSQWRAWRLHRGIHYPPHLHVHEVPCGNNARMVHLETVFLFHYGYIISSPERAYKIQLYDAIDKGRPLPNKVDFQNHPALNIPRKPFTGAQPLPPEEIGLNAPFESDPPSFRLSADATGDRTLEYGWMLLNIPAAFGTKNALDFGSGGVAQLSQRALDHGWQVTALDFEATGAPTGVQMVTGDILSPDLELPTVDMILNCSSIEHVGLAGRYGVTDDDDDGDLKAMRKLYDALAPGGLMLLTIPVGRDHVHAPMHRIYGEGRLPKLLDGFEVLSETYWKKLPNNSWIACSRADALSTYTVAVTKHDWQGVMFNLGAFALRKRA